MLAKALTAFLTFLALLTSGEFSQLCHAQSAARGVVVGSDSQSRIPGASVRSLSVRELHTVTDSLGMFILSVDTSRMEILVEYEGYRPERRFIRSSDSLVVVMLDPLAYDLDEVVVTTIRHPRTLLSAPSTVSVIDRVEIERSFGGSVAEVVSTQSSLFLKDYGAPSALKTISQRGLGAEHTLLLLNGAPINSVQNGMQDLGTLGVDEIEKIEIVRGGQSASYGANAVAGVINLFTREGSALSNILASTSLGSFGEKKLHLAAELPVWFGSIRASFHDQHSEGDFPFWWEGDEGRVRLVRSNSDLSSWGASVNASGDVSPGVRVGLLGLYARSERGVAGPVTSSQSVSRARQSDENGIAQATMNASVGEQSNLAVKVHYEHAYQRYTDPDLVVAYKPLDSYYLIRRLWMEGSANLALNQSASVVVGADGASSWAESNALSGAPRQTQWGLFGVGSIYLSGSPKTEACVLLSPALRLDVVSGGTQAISPQLGILWTSEGFTVGVLGLVRPRVRGSVSRNFRAPTFNELYFNGGGGLGNPNLDPERSTSVELGGGISLNGLGEHHLDVTYFRIAMGNRIMWTGGGSGVVTPKNLRDVLSQGFEFQYRLGIPRTGITCSAEYSLSRSEKRSPDYPGDPNVGTQLVYIPREKLVVTVGYLAELGMSVLKRLSGTVSHMRVGYRYVSEDNTQYLPGFAVTNLAVRCDVEVFQVQLFGRTEFSNLFNEEYQLFLGYPMPLSSYRVTLGATL